jgi:ferritin-like protein
VKVTTRSDLLKLLCEAAELEHGIACSYLYAGFSLKRDLSEGGLTWEEQQMVRRWAAQIYFVASQEMLHLALVWNLTTAIGGTPYYLRPNFPQEPSYYPLKVPLRLEPFGVKSLRRFVQYEHPEDGSPVDRSVKALLDKVRDDEEEFRFESVGEMYGLIRQGFEDIDEKQLFIGAPTQQMTPEFVHFPDLVAVTDRKSALEAIDEITDQGEGRKGHRENSHFMAFVTILKDLLETGNGRSQFAPARPAMVNPSAGSVQGYGAKANPIGNPAAAKVAGLFDSAYSLMLRMLAWSFEFDANSEDPKVDEQLKKFCTTAIDFMPRVLLPIGEGLMLMPAGAKHPGKTAGPGFGLTRHVMLPPDANNALTLCRERIRELAAIAGDVMNSPLPDPVKAGCRHLQQLANSF